MIYNGIIISKEEARLLTQLFGYLLSKPELFKWMHDVGLTKFFDELGQTLREPMEDYIENYYED